MSSFKDIENKIQNGVPFWNLWSYNWISTMIWWYSIKIFDCLELWIFYTSSSLFGLCKILVGAAFRWNVSNFAYCLNGHEFKSSLKHTTLIHALYPRVFLFLLIIGSMCFIIYFQRKLTPIHTLPSSYRALQNSPLKNSKIKSIVNSRT